MSASADLLRPVEPRALASSTSLPSVQELVSSSAPFKPSLGSRALLVPTPSGSADVDGDWLTPSRPATNDRAAPSSSRDERGWEQAREAFLAAGVSREPHSSAGGSTSARSSTRSRAPSTSSAFDLQDLHTTIPTFAHHLPPRVDPPSSFAFDPWGSPSARDAPLLGRQASAVHSNSPFPPSNSPPSIPRPQTYPPARPLQSSPFPQDHRRTVPLPFSHDPRNLGQLERQTDFPFVATSPPPYLPNDLSHPSPASTSWRAHSPSGYQGLGYQHLGPDVGRYGSRNDGYARSAGRSEGAHHNSADAGRFAGPSSPRRRMQSFESGLAPRPIPTNTFRSLPYFPASATMPPPLADRHPFPPSPPVAHPPPSQPQVTAPAPKLRSGLPERSTWAMWVGNVPADATESELWTFFSHRAPLLNVETPSQSVTGVESIHLIARSNCGFINFISSDHLQHAISQSNGIPLRPTERRCKPLVCRVRMREDDAKSGVGAQRGGGLHKAYIKALEEATEKGPSSSAMKRSPSQCSSSSSTTSDLFAEHFPKRYFILKAHSVFDIEESIRTGLWSTQGHNEAVLDQAYRTSEDVFLVFSANKSGSWAGYARMAGPIDSARKSTTTSSPTQVSPVNGSPITQQLPSGLPRRAGSASPVSPLSASLSPVDSIITSSSGSTLQRPSPARSESGGTPFLVDWIKTELIPFIKTRSILNSFNSGREVKISRDGTEVEPMAGEQLLQEFWNDSPATLSPLSSTFTSSPVVGGITNSPRPRRPSNSPSIVSSRHGGLY